MTQGLERFLNDVFIKQLLKLKEPYFHMAIGAYIRANRKHLSITEVKSDIENPGAALSCAFLWSSAPSVKWNKIHENWKSYLREEQSNDTRS